MYSPEYLLNEYDDHINEAFVGLFGTNKLREIIPNFALIYYLIKILLLFIIMIPIKYIFLKLNISTYMNILKV